MADDRNTGRLVVVGANHRTSSEATRDRLFLPEEGQPDVLRAAVEAGFAQCLVLSTCARIELVGIADRPETARDAALGVLCGYSGVDPASFGPETYLHEGEEAVRHLFRVAASLDSPVVGEPDVTGQFRDAVRIAQACGTVGGRLDAVLRSASEAAKRVRTETAIGERPVSMAACALQVARDVHGDLSRIEALLVSGGEMGELVVDQLRAAGLQRLTVVARRAARAEIVARRYDAHFGALDDIAQLLPRTDLVVSSLGAGQYLFTGDRVAAALVARRHRPMLFVDAAIPSDVEAEVNDLDGAFVYSLDDLERLALEGRSRRDEAAGDAEAVVEEEVARFLRASAERGATPAVTALRTHFEQVRADVLRGLGTAGSEAAAEEATRRLVGRLLHGPSEALRALAAESPERAAEAEALLRRMFTTAPDDPADEGEKDK